MQRAGPDFAGYATATCGAVPGPSFLETVFLGAVTGEIVGDEFVVRKRIRRGSQQLERLWNAAPRHSAGGVRAVDPAGRGSWMVSYQQLGHRKRSRPVGLMRKGLPTQVEHCGMHFGTGGEKSQFRLGFAGTSEHQPALRGVHAMEVGGIEGVHGHNLMNPPGSGKRSAGGGSVPLGPLHGAIVLQPKPCGPHHRGEGNTTVYVREELASAGGVFPSALGAGIQAGLIHQEEDQSGFVAIVALRDAHYLMAFGEMDEALGGKIRAGVIALA